MFSNASSTTVSGGKFSNLNLTIDLRAYYEKIQTLAEGPLPLSNPGGDDTDKENPAELQQPRSPQPENEVPVVRPRDTSLAPGKNKFYVVTVGKKTGVFWNQWKDVHPLVNRVSGALHKGFPSEAKAKEFYLHESEKNLVRVVRDRGDVDEVLFGPLHVIME